MNEEAMIVACRLISDAGDGAAKFLMAIRYAEENKFGDARSMLLEGNESLHDAHQQQTNLLHAEAQGKSTEFSLLMVHAQDHLMNATLLKELTTTIINLNERLAKVEKA